MISELRELMTIKEVAKYFGVTTRTVRQWISDGKLKQIKLGWRTVRISKTEVSKLGQ